VLVLTAGALACSTGVAPTLEPTLTPPPPTPVLPSATPAPVVWLVGIEEAESLGACVFHAGTRIENGRLVTSGGRVLGVTAAGADLSSAIANCYAAVSKIHFEGMHYRRDIGLKGLKRWPALE